MRNDAEAGLHNQAMNKTYETVIRPPCHLRIKKLCKR